MSIFRERIASRGRYLKSYEAIRNETGGNGMRFCRLALEKELLRFLGGGRNAHIAAHYYGFDGLGGRTLEEVGMEHGLTRQRVHQLVTPVAKRFSAGQPVLHALERTIAFVNTRTPAAAGKIEAELRSEGLTSNLFRLEGVIKAAELLGRSVPFSITQLNGERLVHRRAIRSINPVVRVARRVIARWGMATISEVAAEMGRVEPGVWERGLVETVLTSRRDFHWLNRPAGWFWLSDNANNPVLNRVKKVLSVANPTHVSDLRVAVARDYRMKRFSPPEEVLLEFFRQAPGLRVSGNMIKTTPPIYARDVLTKTEIIIARLLSEHGRVMTSSELQSVCVGMGVKVTTFEHCLAYSPIVSRYGAGLYGLIGSGKSNGNRVPKFEASTILAARLRARQVAALVGVSPRTVWYHAQAGTLKGTKIGPIWYFDIRDVYEFKTRLASLAEKPW